jgi:ABC-2 type transport system permease protein
VSPSLLPIATLAWREVVRFVRQRSRLTGALLQPVLFWALLGGGFRSSFRVPGGMEGMTYTEYFFPGILSLVLLFTAIFSTISAVEDRQSGFLQGVLAAPISRTSIVLGQAAGCTILAVAQGVLLLLLAPVGGIRLTLESALATTGVMILVALAMTGLGLILAWRLDSTQGFHAIMNLILMPLWLLSGAFFPAEGLPAWLAWIVRINPLTYGMAALRRTLYLPRPELVAALPPLAPSIAATALFALLALAAAVHSAARKGRA